MAKLSFMKFYPYDWMNDTRSLSIEAKGCWIELICLMWNAKEKGRWIGTYEEFARVTGSPWEAAPRLINELSKVATVTKRDNEVTFICRRIMKEDLHYKDNANRQKAFREKHKSNKIVTDKTLDVRLKTLDKDKQQQSATPILDRSNPYQKPDREKELPKFLVYAYKVAKGFPKEDRAWDKANWPRCAKAAKELAELFGHWKPAVDCLDALKKHFDSKGLDWTLETIAKHAHEWKLKKPKETDYAAINRQRIRDADAGKERNGEDPNPGGLASAGEIFASKRTLSSFIPETENIGRVPGSENDRVDG